MHSPNLLGIALEIRYNILELLLVSQSPIKPKLLNHTNDNSTTPSLTNLSQTCAQLRKEALFMFFTKNQFLFDVPSSVYGHRHPREVECYFSKEWLSSFGASPTKLLVQHVTILYFQKQDWYLQNAPWPWHDNGCIREAVAALPFCKDLLKLELIITLPTRVNLCDKHFSMHQKQCNLLQAPRENISGEWSKWCYSEIPYFGRYKAELDIEDMEPFEDKHELIHSEREVRGTKQGGDKLRKHFSTLEKVGKSKLATIKFETLDEEDTYDRMNEYYRDKPWSVVLKAECSWHVLQFIRESIKRLEIEGNMKQVKEELKVLGLNAGKLERP